MLKIVTTPNPVLTTPVAPVVKIDERIKKLVADMEVTLIAQKDPEGVGLAAPQVGISLALFIMKPGPSKPTTAFINPKIVKHVSCNTKHKTQGKKKKKVKLEGCLSVPKIWSPLVRENKVLLHYQDLEGKVHKKWFSGFEAIIIQHEMDHLGGVLFTQRALEKNIPLYEEKDGELEKLKY